jgi:hypothetical protein
LSKDSDSLTGAIDRLRSAIAHATAADDTELLAALAAAPFTHGEIAPGPSGSLSHASVDLSEPVPLEALETRYGPGRRSPPGPRPGRPRTVQFNETLTLEGSVGGTVLAELDDDGQVVRVMIRRDAF